MGTRAGPCPRAPRPLHARSCCAPRPTSTPRSPPSTWTRSRHKVCVGVPGGVLQVIIVPDEPDSNVF
eukprot:506374-Prymnesium_polylepis.1